MRVKMRSIGPIVAASAGTKLPMWASSTISAAWRMMRTLAQTGNGWMTFKDACNRAGNQTAKAGNTVHLSNLCTEIIEVTGDGESAVCNLGSINLAQHHDGVAFDFDKLGQTVQIAVRQLDRVIDLNFYPIDSARASNLRWRPVGLGLMGLQDVLFALRLPFDGAEARALSARISEEIYYWALRTSLELAREKGAHPAFADTRAAAGELQFDAWNVVPRDAARWDALRAEIRVHGLRNSLLIAIAPTATIASIAGCYECIEPQVSNLFKRETLSGDFLQVNRYLVEELKRLGLWTAEIRDAIKLAEGSVQSLTDLPETLRTIYRTVWETPMRALIDMTAIIDLRPDDEEAGQPSSQQVGNAAERAGLSFSYAPVEGGGLPEQAAVDAVSRALLHPGTTVVLYCHSGRRAARAWALAEASRDGGLEAEAIEAAAKSAGQPVDDLHEQISARIATRVKLP